jgi:hypothetical protein
MVAPFGRTITQCGLALSLTAMLAIFSGCGGGEKKNADTDGGSTKSTGSTSSTGSGSKKPSDKGETDERPAIGGIPVDVYFPNPLGVASDQRLVGGPVTPPGPGPGEDPMPDPGPAPDPKPDTVAASSDGPNWSELITVEELLGEVQSIRNDLNSRMVNFGAYKRSTLEVPVFGTTLAFLADIARRHDGEVKWKDKAHFIRALAIAMVDVTSSSTAGAKKSYDAVNESFLKICDILDSNDPPGLPETEVDVDFGDFAELGYLMKRLERGEEWLMTNAGSEAGFKEKGALAKREASVFVVISSSFTSESFSYNEYEDFVKWVHELRDAAKGMHKAVDAEKFDDFDALRSQMSQKCTQCHSVYKNG